MTTERLVRYRPKSLSTDTWELARAAALAAVLMTGVSTEKSAMVLLSHLARFLGWHPAWGRTAPPDLSALLQGHHLDAFIAASPTNRTARPYLRKIARATGALSATPRIRSVKNRPAARRFWATLSDLGSFAALAEAYGRSGYALMATIFEGYGDELASSQWDIGHLMTAASARDDVSDTMTASVSAAQQLRAARDVEPRGVVAVQSTKATSVKSQAAKPLSRTAAVKAAKAKQAERTAAQTRATSIEVPLVQLPTLDGDIAAAIAAFRPHRFSDADWAVVIDATRHLATAYDPPSVQWVGTQMGVLARFCLWAATRPSRATTNEVLRPSELLESGLIEAYLAGPITGSPDSTRATVRSTLRRALKRLAPAQASQVISDQPVQAPYTPLECASWVRLARNQPTATLRRGLSSVVALGLGAGLSSAEQRTVSPESIIEGELPDGTTALFVKVGGAFPRVVVVRAQYEGLLREALDLHRAAGRKPTDPLYGLSMNRRNVTGPVTGRAKTAIATGVDVDPARLRSTWLVAVMSAPVPLGALLRSAGLRSARTLVDLVGYCPDPDETAVAVILRTFEDRSDGVTS